jgi:hypothetical protein
MEWFASGGFPMLFIAVFGSVALAGALRFALQPAPGRVGPVVAYGLAVGLAAVAGVAVDLATVARFASGEAIDPDQRARIVLVGVSEALSPAVLGFAVLSVVALITAIGLRRMPVD